MNQLSCLLSESLVETCWAFNKQWLWSTTSVRMTQRSISWWEWLTYLETTLTRFNVIKPLYTIVSARSLPLFRKWMPQWAVVCCRGLTFTDKQHLHKSVSPRFTSVITTIMWRPQYKDLQLYSSSQGIPRLTWRFQRINIEYIDWIIC